MYFDFILDLWFSRKEIKKSFIGMTKKEKVIHSLFYILEIGTSVIVTALFIVTLDSDKDMLIFALIGLAVLLCLCIIHFFIEKKNKRKCEKSL